MLRFALLFVAIIGTITCFAVPEVEKVEIASNFNDYWRASPLAKLALETRDLESDGVPYTVGRRQNGKFSINFASKRNN